MDNVLETIDPHRLGQELQEARKRRRFTQEDAAKVLGVARTTITAIEKGDRQVKAGELIKLARAYACTVSDLIRQRPAVGSFKVQFRGPAGRSEADEEIIAPAITQFEELCRNYLELEDLLHAPIVKKYPAEYEIVGLKTEQAAESIAASERNRLGIGDGAIPILRNVLEQDVGLRVFYLSLPSKFSAMYTYGERLGGCIAVNSNHPEDRRRWSLAHDYGHFLAHRYRSSVSARDLYQRIPESERFADAFATYFLMPTAGVTRRFTDIQRVKSKVAPADLCMLAYYYGVSVEAMTLRLESLRLLPSGVWDRLRDNGFRVRDAQRELGIEALPSQEDLLPMRYQYLAIEAYDQGMISEEQFAKFMQVDRIEARRISTALHGVVFPDADSGGWTGK